VRTHSEAKMCASRSGRNLSKAVLRLKRLAGSAADNFTFASHHPKPDSLLQYPLASISTTM
jgi:hypothetical protein